MFGQTFMRPSTSIVCANDLNSEKKNATKILQIIVALIHLKDDHEDCLTSTKLMCKSASYSLHLLLR